MILNCHEVKDLFGGSGGKIGHSKISADVAGHLWSSQSPAGSGGRSRGNLPRLLPLRRNPPTKRPARPRRPTPRRLGQRRRRPTNPRPPHDPLTRSSTIHACFNLNFNFPHDSRPTQSQRSQRLCGGSLFLPRRRRVRGGG